MSKCLAFVIRPLHSFLARVELGKYGLQTHSTVEVYR